MQGSRLTAIYVSHQFHASGSSLFPPFSLCLHTCTRRHLNALTRFLSEWGLRGHVHPPGLCLVDVGQVSFLPSEAVQCFHRHTEISVFFFRISEKLYCASQFGSVNFVLFTLDSFKEPWKKGFRVVWGWDLGLCQNLTLQPFLNTRFFFTFLCQMQNRYFAPRGHYIFLNLSYFFNQVSTWVVSNVWKMSISLSSCE